MSEREVRRVEVLNEVQSGRRTVAAAASVPGISERQAYRLLARFQENSCSAWCIRHAAECRTGAIAQAFGVRRRDGEDSLRLLRSNAGQRSIAERHAIHIGRETLRRWRTACGCRASSARPSTSPGFVASRYGELVQIDVSEDRWFEDCAEPCTLLVSVDDATSKLMQLRFVPSESTESYFQALRGYLHEHGCPVAFYSDTGMAAEAH